MEMHTSPFWREKKVEWTNFIIYYIQKKHSGTIAMERKQNKIKRKQFHLINVGVPHLGEEAEGWWGVRVVDWKLDVSLGEKTEVDSF